MTKELEILKTKVKKLIDNYEKEHPTGYLIPYEIAKICLEIENKRFKRRDVLSIKSVLKEV